MGNEPPSEPSGENLPAKAEPTEGAVPAPKGTITRTEEFYGPIPPPYALRIYEEVLPGAADRIVAGSEEERQHRHHIETHRLEIFDKLDTKRVEGMITLMHRGQWMAFILALAFFAGAIFLLSTGHDATGIGLLVAEITALAGLFLYRQIAERKPNKEKPNSEGAEDQGENMDRPAS